MKASLLKRISKAQAPTSCAKDAEQLAPELLSLGSSSQSQDEGGQLVSANYIPAQKQNVNLCKGGTKNIKIVKVKNSTSAKSRAQVSEHVSETVRDNIGQDLGGLGKWTTSIICTNPPRRPPQKSREFLPPSLKDESWRSTPVPQEVDLLPRDTTGITDIMRQCWPNLSTSATTTTGGQGVSMRYHMRRLSRGLTVGKNVKYWATCQPCTCLLMHTTPAPMPMWAATLNIRQSAPPFFHSTILDTSEDRAQ